MIITLQLQIIMIINNNKSNNLLQLYQMLRRWRQSSCYWGRHGSFHHLKVDEEMSVVLNIYASLSIDESNIPSLGLLAPLPLPP